jgi:integrase
LEACYLHEHRLYALLATLIDTGCRNDELLKLDRPQIDFDNLLITVTARETKNESYLLVSSFERCCIGSCGATLLMPSFLVVMEAGLDIEAS